MSASDERQNAGSGNPRGHASCALPPKPVPRDANGRVRLTRMTDKGG